jgi:hypothetical protein
LLKYLQIFTDIIDSLIIKFIKSCSKKQKKVGRHYVFKIILFIQSPSIYCCHICFNIKAYSWFNLAAERGNADAADYRIRIGKIMTKQQIAKGEELSKKLNLVDKSANEKSKSDYETQ